MRPSHSLAGLGLTLLTLTACGPLKALQGPPSDPLQVLAEASVLGRPPQLRPQPLATGDETPYTPVMLPPDVRRAFVRGHINAQRDLIGGHWWYVRIEDWSWPVEREARLTPSSAPLHVPLAPQPSRPQSSDAASPGLSLAPVQPPGPRSALNPGAPVAGRLPQIQLAPSPGTVPPAARPASGPPVRHRAPVAGTEATPVQED